MSPPREGRGAFSVVTASVPRQVGLAGGRAGALPCRSRTAQARGVVRASDALAESGVLSDLLQA